MTTSTPSRASASGAAECIIAEIGLDMTRFLTAGHLASWAGMCPGNNITGGKRKSGTTNKGNRWLGEILHQCASAASQNRDTYLAAQYWRLVRRIGKRKATVAVGHSILIICWHLLANDCDYDELGGDWFAGAPTTTSDATTSSANSKTSATESPSPTSPPEQGGSLLTARSRGEGQSRLCAL